VVHFADSPEGSALVSDQTAAVGKVKDAIERLLRKGEKLMGDSLDAALKKAVGGALKRGDPEDLFRMRGLFSQEELQDITDAIARIRAPAEMLARLEAWREREAAVQGRAGEASNAQLGNWDPKGVAEVYRNVEPMWPEEAYRQVARLTPRMEATPRELAQGIRDESFSMAVASDVEMLGMVQEHVLQAVGRGLSGTELRNAIEDEIVKAGLEPLNAGYSEMVARTNTLESFRKAGDEAAQDPDIREMFPVYEYVGIEDGREGDDHRPLFGKYFPIALPFTTVRNAAGPRPRPFSCRCDHIKIDRFDWQELQAQGAELWDLEDVKAATAGAIP